MEFSKKSERQSKQLKTSGNKGSGFSLEDNRKEVAQRKPNKTGLPDNLKSGIENMSGHSMDDVKVHYNSSKPAQYQAHAYAQGSQIHLASGQERHLPHEAWHVVQQKQGRVKPTMQMNGGAINDDPSLEKEADVMGGKAMQLKPRENSYSNNIHHSLRAESFSLTKQLRKSPTNPIAKNGFTLQFKTNSNIFQFLRFKHVTDSGRRHYNDGWGALYHIQNDNSLKANVNDNEPGNWTQDIGRYYHAGENRRRNCTIGYRNTARRGPRGRNDIVTSIYHCGPSSQ